MRYVAAYLLAALGGNESPSAENIEKILSSVGIEAEADKLNKVIAELKGKSLQTLIAEGKIVVKLWSISMYVMIPIFRVWKLKMSTFFWCLLLDYSTFPVNKLVNIHFV